MVSSVNKSLFVGYVGKDPDIHTTKDGGKFSSFSLATTKRWKCGVTGERKEKTNWHRIVVYNENIAKFVESYVKKGSRLYVEGELEYRKYVDKKSGEEKSVTEIVLDRFNGNIQMLDKAEGEIKPTPVVEHKSYPTTTTDKFWDDDPTPF